MSTFDDLPLRPPVEPMESRQAAKIPIGDEWQYEPKWDGFRCLVFRSGGNVELESKSGQSLARYFPELVAAALAVDAGRFVLDGEIYIERDAGFDFDALLQRIHPAASRVARLAVETPARYAAFDLLVNASGERCYEWPLQRRRIELERFARSFADGGTFAPSPATTDVDVARRWLAGDTARLDGVIAKRVERAVRVRIARRGGKDQTYLYRRLRRRWLSSIARWQDCVATARAVRRRPTRSRGICWKYERRAAAAGGSVARTVGRRLRVQRRCAGRAEPLAQGPTIGRLGTGGSCDRRRDHVRSRDGQKI